MDNIEIVVLEKSPCTSYSKYFHCKQFSALGRATTKFKDGLFKSACSKMSASQSEKNSCQLHVVFNWLLGTVSFSMGRVCPRFHLISHPSLLRLVWTGLKIRAAVTQPISHFFFFLKSNKGAKRRSEGTHSCSLPRVKGCHHLKNNN